MQAAWGRFLPPTGKLLRGRGESRGPFDGCTTSSRGQADWPAWPRPRPAGRLTAGTRPAAGPETREIVIVLTDGHEHGGEIRAALAPLRARRHELLLFHLLGRDEIDFPFHGPVRFEDLETGATLETDADAARAAWIAGQEAHVREWRRAWAGDGRFDYASFRLDEPLDRVLRFYLSQRQLRR